MKISVFRIFLISLFIIIFLIFYKGLNNTNIYTPNFNSERNIPYIESEIFNTNNKINSKDIVKGNKFYLMNIWASWCIPCRDEHPFLMKLAKQKLVPVHAIDWREVNRTAGPAWLRKFGDPYMLIGDDPRSKGAIAFGVTGAPETFVIDAEGVIRYKYIGPLSQQSWDETIWPIIQKLRESGAKS